MQLARSFAERTNCPVMRYLADAQFLGLVGLWQKLCDGRLPPRCSKLWFFETFCGEDASTFASRGRDALGESVDITTYLTGHVKPYDVLALMTVLPQTEALFARPVALTCENANSLLLLTADDAVPVEHVLNLLRDTYHEVVLATGSGGVSQSQRQSKSQSQSRRASLAARITPSLRGQFGGNAMASGALRNSAPALRTAEPLAPAEITCILSDHIGLAHAQEQMIVRVALLCAFSLFVFALGAAAVETRISSQVDDGRVIRYYIYRLLAVLAVCALCFSLSPTRGSIVKTRLVIMVFGLVNLGFSVVLHFETATRVLEVQWYAATGTLSALFAIERAYVACRFAVSISISLVLLVRMVVAWRRPRALVAAQFFAAGLLLTCLGLLDFVIVGLLAYQSSNPAQPVANAILGLIKAVSGYALLKKKNPVKRVVDGCFHLHRRKETGNGTTETFLAILLGYGTLLERDPKELVQEAARTFVPVIASEQYLRALGPTALFGSSEADDVAALRTRAVGRLMPRAPHHARVEELDAATSPPPMASAECYVVQGKYDDPQAKLDALASWACEFEHAHNGRSPSICIGGMSDILSPVELLEHMPVYIARSNRLLILAGPELPAQLWCAMECYTWFALGGRIEDVEVAIVGADAGNISTVVSAFDAFHVMYSLSDGDSAARRRLMAATELAGIAAFNMTLRRLVPRVKEAADRLAAELGALCGQPITFADGGAPAGVGRVK